MYKMALELLTGPGKKMRARSRWYAANSRLFHYRNSRVGKYPGAGVIFYPIPKNASSSVHALLLYAEGLTGREKLHNPGYNVDLHLRALGAPYDMLRLQLGLREKRHLFRFSFVRNPWERLLSCYVEKIARPDEEFLDVVLKGYYPGINFRGMDFPDFVRFVYRLPARKMEPHFLPQHWFFRPSAMDLVGRVENFARDMQQLVSRQIGRASCRERV